MLLDNVRLVVSVAAFGVFVTAMVRSVDFFGIGRWFPLIVTVGGAVLAGLNMAFEIWRYVRARRRRAASTEDDPAPVDVAPRPKMDTVGAATSAEFLASARWFAIVLSCPLTMYVAGAVVGAGLWVAVFMLFVARRRRVFAAISAGAVMGMLLLYSYYFNLQLPQGVLFS